jgi:hypothetical protein
MTTKGTQLARAGSFLHAGQKGGLENHPANVLGATVGATSTADADPLHPPDSFSLWKSCVVAGDEASPREQGPCRTVGRCSSLMK